MKNKDRLIFVDDETWERVREAAKGRGMSPSNMLVEIFEGGRARGIAGSLARIESLLKQSFPDAKELTVREQFKLDNADKFCPQCTYRYRECDCP